MPVYEFSMGLDKLKCYKTIIIGFMDALGSLLGTREAKVTVGYRLVRATRTLLSCLATSHVHA